MSPLLSATDPRGQEADGCDRLSESDFLWCGNRSVAGRSRWSSSAAFSLPGWTYPTGTTQLYLGQFHGLRRRGCGGPYGISVAFVGRGTNGQKGIYAMPSPSRAGAPALPLSKIIDLNDTLDGRASPTSNWRPAP